MKRFKELDKKKRIIIISGISVVLLVAVVIIYRTYAIYQEKQDFNVIKGSVPEYMGDYDVRLSLTIDGTPVSDFPSCDSGKVFENAECDKGAIGLWDYDIWGPKVANSTKTRTKCKYHFVSKYSESVLNGADPVLSDGLIPVVIDNNGVVRKANLGSEWYKYENKVWANAVILEDENIVYQNNEVIPEENIESYFVWIPRFRYKIFNDGNYTGLTSLENKVQTIEIEFENKEKTISNGSHVEEWLTHPAFVSFDVNGMWVGKFETGYKGASNTTSAEHNIASSTYIQVKPNVYSWRQIQVSNAFLVSYDYQREMDSHLIKNTEWGAVAYLYQSKYGMRNRIRINNNGAYITGYAARNEPTCGFSGVNEVCNKYEETSLGADGTYTVNYKNNASAVASTTGNYSGVYDMSGGTQEYVMGVVVDKSGNPISGNNNYQNSGFVGSLTIPSSGSDTTKSYWRKEDGGVLFPEEKYYDKYAYSEDYLHYNRRILGDATGEIGPFETIYDGIVPNPVSSWYGNLLWFPSGINEAWFCRGSSFIGGTRAGVFASYYASGRISPSVGFRIVLSI